MVMRTHCLTVVGARNVRVAPSVGESEERLQTDH